MREGLHYEDFSPEAVYRSMRRTVTEADLVSFAAGLGFYEPLFMDREYVEQETPYGKRIVPAALTFSMAEGLAILSGIVHKTGVAFLGAEIKVLRPVFVGDTLRVEIYVMEKRPVSNPVQGIVRFRHRVVNQNEEPVMEYSVERMLKRKPG